jgi:hypothetical protein
MVIKLTNVNLAINNWYFQGEENQSNTEAKVWASEATRFSNSKMRNNVLQYHWTVYN